MLVSDGTDVAQSVDEMSRRHMLPFPIQRSLQTLRIPGHDAVRQEGQGAGSGDELLNPPTAVVVGNRGARNSHTDTWYGEAGLDFALPYAPGRRAQRYQSAPAPPSPCANLPRWRPQGAEDPPIRLESAREPHLCARLLLELPVQRILEGHA